MTPITSRWQQVIIVQAMRNTRETSSISDSACSNLFDHLFERNRHSPNLSLALSHTNAIINKIERSLNSGALQITHNHQTLLTERAQNSKDMGEESRLSIHQFGGSQAHSHTRPSAEDHIEMVNRFIRDHAKADRKRKRNMSQMEERVKEQELRHKSEERELVNRVNEEKRKMMEESGAQRRENQEKRKLQLMEANRRFEQIKHSRNLYEVLEQKYKNQVLLPSLEERKHRLKELREFKRPVNVEELRDFEKNYLENKEILESKLQEKRKQHFPKYNPPPKSSKLERLLEEEFRQLHTKEEQEKRDLSEKIQRTEVYANYLREKFVPRKKKALSAAVADSANPRKDKLTKSRELRDYNKQMGDKYLQYSKKHAAKNPGRSRSSSIENLSQGTDITSKINYLQRKDHQHYQNLRLKKMETVIHSETITRQEKLIHLTRESDRLNEMARKRNKLIRARGTEDQEEMSDILLASIKAKMGILQVINS